MRPKTMAYSMSTLISLLLMFGTAYAVKSVDVLGSPLLFALGLLMEVILLVVLVYSLVRAFKAPLHILGSIAKSAWKGVLNNSYVKRTERKNNRLLQWVTSRLDPKNPFGLLFSAGMAVTILFFLGFSIVLKEVWFKEPLTRIDTRVVNLMPSIRTHFQTSFFRYVTFTANTEAIIFLVVLTVIILWSKRQRVAACMLIVVLMVEEGSVLVLKQLVGRMRPERSLSLYREDSFSFPSGHALSATVIFGFLAYLLYRSFKSSTVRLGIVLGYVTSVALVALSRIYLGVHYPSDVLASILIGASLLTLIITGLEITVRFKLWGQSHSNFTNKRLGIVPILIVLMSIVAGPVLIRLTPVVASPSFTTINIIDDTTIKKLPLYSETLTGKTMEPISFIFTGTQQQIEQVFKSHGWFVADPSTLANTLKALSVGLQGRQYLNAPVTPSYLAAKPESLALQQPTKSNTLRQRHHTRIWHTDFKLANGREVWVGTASFDEGIEFAGPAKLPTHHIDPNIDAERSYIVSSLDLHNVNYLQAVSAQAGKNASGDTFFTDGKAVVINL